MSSFDSAAALEEPAAAPAAAPRETRDVTASAAPAALAYRPPLSSMPFSKDKSLDDEMREVQALRQTDGEALQQLFRRGERVVSLASAGYAETLETMCKDGKGRVLQWHTAKAFLAACEKGHLGAVRAMVAGGAAVADAPLDGALAAVCASCDGSEPFLALLAYLANECGAPVDRCDPADWRTPLHVACALGKRRVALCLVDRCKADINAVAAEDKMPLTLAIDAAADPDASEGGRAEARKLVDDLRTRGAKTTWRRAPQQTGAK